MKTLYIFNIPDLKFTRILLFSYELTNLLFISFANYFFVSLHP